MDRKITTDNPHEEQAGEIRAPCGFLCSTCQAFAGNIHGDTDRDRVHDAWQKVYGLDIPPGALCCDGCHKPDSENPHRIGGDCPIRTCVRERGFEHCGYCGEFPCERMERHLSSVEDNIPRCRSMLSDQEFSDFVEPYLCREFLETAGKK